MRLLLWLRLFVEEAKEDVGMAALLFMNSTSRHTHLGEGVIEILDTQWAEAEGASWRLHSPSLRTNAHPYLR